MATRTAGPTAVSSATGGQVAPSPTSQSGTAASPPAAGGHTAAGESGLKAHRRELANLIKTWYVFVRKYEPDYFKKELWGRKGNWQPVWNKVQPDIEDSSDELKRLLDARPARAR